MDIEVSSVPIHFLLDDQSAPKVDQASRVVDYVACNDKPFDRYDWFKGEKYLLQFSHKPDAVNLDRVKARQCGFLLGHSGMFSEPSRIGRVIAAKLKDGQLLTKHKISTTASGEEYWQEILGDTDLGVSIEANVTELTVIRKAKYEDDTETDDSKYSYRRKKLVEPALLEATKWELLAISAVNISAVVGATRKATKEEQEQLSKLPKILVKCSGETGYEFLFDQLEDQVNDKTETPKESLKMSENDIKEKSEAKTQDESRLKFELSQLQKAHKETTEKLSKTALENQYWQLRLSAQSLYALENKMAEDEFNLYYSENPNDDLQKLSVANENDRIESIVFLRSRENFNTLSSRKSAVERLTKEKDLTLLALPTIEAKKADTEVGTREQSSDETQKASATKFLDKYQPRRIG